MKIYYDYIFLLIIVLFFIMKYLNDRKINEHFDNKNKNYRRCDSIPFNGLLNDIFNKNKINITNGENWDIYLPCGYNEVEDELPNIKSIHNDQVIYAISGCDKIVSKDYLWKLLRNKYNNTANTIMPSTWRLFDTEEMKNFKLLYNVVGV